VSYRTASRITLAFLAGLVLSAAANAQLFRAYVASTGNDANPCTLPAPCRLLPRALTTVASGGEIWMLDSANYNASTVTIPKSVTFLAVPGVIGSVVATGGPALSISTAGLAVALRNLVIVPLTSAPGTYGVQMTAASTLTIDGCLLANLQNNAVHVVGPGTLSIANSIVRNNLDYAVWLENGAVADVSSTKMLNNAVGGVRVFASAASTSTATVSDSIISGGQDGVIAYANVAGGTARIFVTRSTIQNTGYALNSQSSGVGSTLVAVSASMVTNNGNAWLQLGAGSMVRSLGNNHLTDNAGSLGALTTSTLQ
jgi:hypothetical protein